MSEVLLYNRDYQTSYKKNDIVEVQPDGYYTELHSFNRNTFLVIQFTGIPVDKSLQAVELNPDNTIKYKRKVKIKDIKIPQDFTEGVLILDNLTQEEYQDYLKVKE